MVHLDLGHPNAALLQVAGDLAERFQAGIIGIAARQPMQMVYGDGYVSGDYIDEDRLEIQSEIKAAESEFRNALAARTKSLEWRSTITLESLSDCLAAEARSADIVVATAAPSDWRDASRRVDIGDLIMRVGRPVLIVPPTAGRLRFEHAMLAWKDTREARRAASDALPLLKEAARVSVVSVAAEAEQITARATLDKVIAWLGHHGVVAEAFVSVATGDDAGQIGSIAAKLGADIVVAGAYGHSRLREWVLGGVTRDLLLEADRLSLVSH
jgi:nucleotide-binding universal stress UspA family protein